MVRQDRFCSQRKPQMLSDVQIRLAKGDGEISVLKKGVAANASDIAALPCKAPASQSGACPTQAAQALPTPAPAATGQPLIKIAPEGWTFSYGSLSGLAGRHWLGALIGVLGTSGIYGAWQWLKAALAALAQHPPLDGF